MTKPIGYTPVRSRTRERFWTHCGGGEARSWLRLMEVRKARRKAATPAPLLPSGTGAPRSRLKPAKAANSSSSNRAEVLLEEGGQGPCQQAVERCASPQGRPIGVSPFSPTPSQATDDGSSSAASPSPLKGRSKLKAGPPPRPPGHPLPMALSKEALSELAETVTGGTEKEKAYKSIETLWRVRAPPNVPRSRRPL